MHIKSRFGNRVDKHQSAKYNEKGKLHAINIELRFFKKALNRANKVQCLYGDKWRISWVIRSPKMVTCALLVALFLSVYPPLSLCHSLSVHLYLYLWFCLRWGRLPCHEMLYGEALMAKTGEKPPASSLQGTESCQKKTCEWGRMWAFAVTP